jgi:D-ala D-ala ligase C-terminus
MPSHLIGLLLGTEDDWPSAFESLLERLGPIEWHGQKHELTTERIVNEPFDLRYRPRYSLVIDRLAWWYDLPRAWLKKVALMDDVYLLNNPFTFQSMEKHSAYCAMIRLGLKVPDTWLIPHKEPTPIATFDYMAEKFLDVAARYNAPFELDEIGERVGYPLFMKPFDGGQWVGVSRVGSSEELRARYDESGERMMHLQAAIEDFDVFARSLSIGAETMVMRFEPDRPMHDRYQVEHGFLSPDLGWEIVTVSRLVNAFFRWEFNSCETIVKDGKGAPIDYANASPDVAITSLHYYFPWAMRALVRWTAFALVTDRQMRIDLDPREYFAIGDREDLSYDEKLREYRRLADEYFETARYEEFVAESLARLDELTVDYFESQEFDDLLVQIVRSTFPEHEQEHFVEHYRGLVGAWAADQQAPA